MRNCHEPSTAQVGCMRPRTIDKQLVKSILSLLENHQSHGCGQTIIIHDFIYLQEPGKQVSQVRNSVEGCAAFR